VRVINFRIIIIIIIILYYIITSCYATWFTAGGAIRIALYDNFGKSGNYVIMTSLTTS